MRKEFVIRVAATFVVVLTAFGAYSYLTVPREGTPEPIVIENEEKRAVSFRVVESGAQAANISVRKNYAAYTQEAFEKVWNMVHGTSGAEKPVVDFSQEYVIAVFAGKQPTGGHSIAVAAVVDALNTRTVDVTLTKPGEGCIVTQALTNPYQVVVVPLSDASLTHKDTEIEEPCR